VVTLIERSFWETLGDPVSHSFSTSLMDVSSYFEYQQRQAEGDRVWGAAYHIIPAKVKEVQEYLDIREINGYSIRYTPFHPADPSVDDIRCMVYIGMPDNPQFTGALEPADVAKKINESRGPSGENREYLLQLEQALSTLSSESGDEHVSDLARRVREMAPVERSKTMGGVGEHPLHKVGSTEEQEEIEKDS
jgi:cation transport protein ChaC